VGTKKVKGDETDDRRHRRSALISVPLDPAATVTLDQLRLVAQL
jgi:hypothetical protein